VVPPAVPGFRKAAPGVAPASEDGVELGGVKRPCVLTVGIAREPAEPSSAVEEPGRRKAAAHLADDERRDERAVRCRVLLHQALQASVTCWMEWGGEIWRASANSW